MRHDLQRVRAPASITGFAGRVGVGQRGVHVAHVLEQHTQRAGGVQIVAHRVVKAVFITSFARSMNARLCIVQLALRRVFQRERRIIARSVQRDRAPSAPEPESGRG